MPVDPDDLEKEITEEEIDAMVEDEISRGIN